MAQPTDRVTLLAEFRTNFRVEPPSVLWFRPNAGGQTSTREHGLSRKNLGCSHNHVDS